MFPTPFNLNTNVIDGLIVPGYGAAGANLMKQLPMIEATYPPVKGCFNGSMNVLLTLPLRIIDPDHTTPPISWDDPNRSEKFSLTQIDFECPRDGPHYEAWIYDPHDSPHRFNDYLIEVISEPIPNVKYGVFCRVHLLKPHKIYGVVVV